MLTYRGFKIERVLHHSNSGRLHLRPSGVIGIGRHQWTRYAILERIVADHWIEIGSVEQQEDAFQFIDDLLHHRGKQTDRAIPA